MRSDARRSVVRARGVDFEFRTEPLPRLTGFFAPPLDAEPPPPDRAPRDALGDGLGILAAPARLLGRGRGVLIEHFADLLHEIFGQTRFRHERVASGPFRAFRDAGERVS